MISQINESVYALARICLQPPYSYTCAESYLLHVIEDHFCFYLLQDRNVSDCRLPNLVSSNPDNLRRDQLCLSTICEAAAFLHCPAPLSQVRIQPQNRLLSVRRKKALFVSPSPDTALKRAKGIYETPKKCRVEKTGEIFRNLPFFRRLACQRAVFLVRIDFDHTTLGITTKPMHIALFSKPSRDYLFLDRPLPW